MKSVKDAMLLYAVTDRCWLGSRTLREDVEKALQGGVTCLQLREKNLDFQSFVREAEILKKLCKTYQVPFIINDNVQVAVACGADGIHVGQHDMTACEVRKMVGENCIVGVSAQTVEQALAAEKAGADYLGVGAVFSTSTKNDADAVSLETLRAICNAVSIPVVAIGGIHQQNVDLLQGSGIDGIAVVSALFAQKDIRFAAAELKMQAEKLFC